MAGEQQGGGTSRSISAQQRGAERDVYAGAQDAGVKIAGLAEVTVYEDSFAGSKAEPVLIGQKITVTVRVAADGSILPRRENSDGSTPPATSILTIDVTPSVEFDSNGDAHVIWNGHASQVDVGNAHVIASSLSGPSRENADALEGGRPALEYGNDPAYIDGILDLHATTRAEAVTQALGSLAGSGRMNVGEADRPLGGKPSANRRTKVVTAVAVAAAGTLAVLSLTGNSTPPDAANDSVIESPLDQAETAATEDEPPGSEIDGPEESIPSGAADWSTDDPLGDYEQWSDFDVIDRTRERGGVNAGEFQDAADLSGISVSVAGDSTLVTVSHAGDAQSFQAESEGDFSESVVLVLSDGTRWEVIFHDDGSVKIVSAPPGVSVTKEWITPQQVLFTLSGITVDAGSTIEATLFLEIFGGAMIDVVNLIATG